MEKGMNKICQTVNAKKKQNKDRNDRSNTDESKRMYVEVRKKVNICRKIKDMTKKLEAIEKFNKNKERRNLYQEAKKLEQPHNVAFE